MPLQIVISYDRTGFGSRVQAPWARFRASLVNTGPTISKNTVEPIITGKSTCLYSGKWFEATSAIPIATPA